jgi:hypothetical protein
VAKPKLPLRTERAASAALAGESPPCDEAAGSAAELAIEGTRGGAGAGAEAGVEAKADARAGAVTASLAVAERAPVEAERVAVSSV